MISSVDIYLDTDFLDKFKQEFGNLCVKLNQPNSTEVSGIV